MRPEVDGEPLYMAFQGFRARGGVKLGAALSGMASAASQLAGRHDAYTVAGFYESLSSGVDFFAWLAAWDPKDLAYLRRELKEEAYRLGAREAFFWLSVYKRSPYYPSPEPDEVYEGLRRGRRLPYLVYYPMKKSPEWYLEPREERGRVMAEHIAIARKAVEAARGEVRSYTTYTFGLAPWEFLVVYEVEDLAEWTWIVEELRRARARKWVVLESPVIVGLLHPAFK